MFSETMLFNTIQKKYIKYPKSMRKLLELQSYKQKNYVLAFILKQRRSGFLSPCPLVKVEATSNLDPNHS